MAVLLLAGRPDAPAATPDGPASKPATGSPPPAPAPPAATISTNEIIGQLDFPRGDAAGQARAREVITAALATHGLTVLRHAFGWRAGRAVVCGALWIAAAILILIASLRHGSTALAGILGACFLTGLGIVALGGGLDRLLPISPAVNLETVIEPTGSPLREVLLGAHYDSKTELFDHVERAVWIAVVVLLASAALACIRSRPSWARRLASATALGLAILGAHFTSGAWLAPRGHGVLDDAAACAAVITTAVRLHAVPLQNTRVRCVWWAGEETGAQGSRSDARRVRVRPDAVVNLECIGAGPRLGYAALEWTGRGLAHADSRLVARLEAAAGRRLVRVPFPVITDAGSWRRIGVPAMTLLHLPAHGWAPRYLHGPGDRRTALDLHAVDATVELLSDWLASVDAVPPDSSVGAASDARSSRSGVPD